MYTQPIQFYKTAAVEKNVESFSRQQFALLVLAICAQLPATGFGFLI